MLLLKKAADILQEGFLFEYLFPNGRVAGKNVAVGLVAIERVGTEMIELSLIVVLQKIRRVGIDLRCGAVEHDLAGEFALPLVEVFLLIKGGNSNDLSGDLARSSG